VACNYELSGVAGKPWSEITCRNARFILMAISKTRKKRRDRSSRLITQSASIVIRDDKKLDDSISINTRSMLRVRRALFLRTRSPFNRYAEIVGRF